MGLMPKKGAPIRVHDKAHMKDSRKRVEVHAPSSPGRSGAQQPNGKVHHNKIDRSKVRIDGPPNGGDPTPGKSKHGGEIRGYERENEGGSPDKLALAADKEEAMAEQQGLMGRGPADEAPPQDAAPDDQSRYTDDNDNGVTPEEQAEYDAFVKNGLRLIYDEQTHKPQEGILDALGANGYGPEQQQPQGQPAPQEAPPQQGMMGGQAPASEPAAPPPEQGQPGGMMAAAQNEGGQSMGGMPPPQIIALANATVTIVQQLDDSARAANKPVSNDVLVHGGVAILEELAELAETAGIHDYTEEEMGGATTLAMDMYKQKAMDDGRTDESTAKVEWDQVVQADQQGQLGSVVKGLGAS